MENSSVQNAYEQFFNELESLIQKKHASLLDFSADLVEFLLPEVVAEHAAVYLKTTETHTLKRVYATKEADIHAMPNTQVGEVVFFEDQLLIPLVKENDWLGAIILKNYDRKAAVEKHFELMQIRLMASLKCYNLIREQCWYERMRVVNEHLLSYQTDQNGHIVEVSHSLANELGMTREALLGEMADRVFTDEENETHTAGEHIFHLTAQNGKEIWLRSNTFTTFNFLGEDEGQLHLQENITDFKRIEKMSITDELTGLYNRRFFNELFPREVDRTLRNHTILAFFIIDIDFFKKYNDTYGHPAGDEALKHVGHTLNNCFKRRGDYVFRLGGEEFAAICNITQVDDAEQLASLAREAVSALNIEHTGNPHRVITISCGVAALDNAHVLDSQELYKLADQALYTAKAKGRNCIQIAGNDDDIELF